MERGEELIGNECITIEEIQMIIGGDFEAAEHDHKMVRESLGFNSDDLLVTQYCEYHGLDEDDIIEFLNGLRREPEWKDKIESPDFDVDLDEVDQVPQVLQDFPFELFDKNAEPELDDFQTFFNETEKGGLSGDNADYQ